MSRRSTGAMALAAASLVVAFSLGRRSAPARVERDHQVERISRIVQGRAAGRGPSSEELRAVIREELERHSPEPVAADASAQAEPEDESALVAARAVLDRGMADGRWTAGDRDELRAELQHLSGEQAQEIFHLLVPALNADRVRADFEGPPL